MHIIQQRLRVTVHYLEAEVYHLAKTYLYYKERTSAMSLSADSAAQRKNVRHLAKTREGGFINRLR